MHEKKDQHVIIIDDDQFLVDMYAHKFKEEGFSVDPFMSGLEALQKIREKKVVPDVLLIDIVMPEVDGFGILETLRKESLCPEAAIIMLSNQGQDSDKERAKQFGIDGYIIKANSIPSEVVSQVVAVLKEKSHNA